MGEIILMLLIFHEIQGKTICDYLQCDICRVISFCKNVLASRKK